MTEDGRPGDDASATRSLGLAKTQRSGPGEALARASLGLVATHASETDLRRRGAQGPSSEPSASSEPGLADTHASVDGPSPAQMGLAKTHHSARPLSRADASLGLADTHFSASDAGLSADRRLETDRAGDLGTRDTLDTGRGLARPNLDDPAERQRRASLKARLFGGPAQVVRIGRFQVLDRLGAGGMGVVYSAYDDRLDRKVAVKVLRSEAAGTTSSVRLQREAQAMARLSHPNIVAVHEVGEDNGDVFVAMEFVRGRSLDVWLEERRPWAEVLEVFMQAGRGLLAAHEAGLIHRDFKPHNAILGDDGRVKVLDFGLARASAEALTEGDVSEGDGSLMELHLTRTGAMLGTPAYMSPEQFLGGEVTAASDQFAFFIALYEGLYGDLPFAGNDLAELVASVTSGEVTAPPADSGVPGWIRKIVMRGLAVAPAERFPDMQAALAALARDPAKRRRRWFVLTGLAGGSAAISAAVAMAGAAPVVDRCADVRDPVEAVVGAARLGEARGAFAATGELGVDTWALIAPRVEGWGQEWAELRAARCEAYAAGELSDTLYDRSVACLERQLARVDGLMSAFVVADAQSVEQAPAAIAALPPLVNCVDTEFLLAEVAPPEDMAAREAVEAARESIEKARASVDLGRYDAALSLAAEAAEVAKEHGYEPLAALAEVVRGDALQWRRDGEGAEAALSAALERGLASGADRAAAEAVARRMFVRAELRGEAAQALGDEALGEALLRRVGDDPRLAWVLMNNAAVAYERAGRIDEALRRHEQALEVAVGLGENATEPLYTHYNLGLMLLHSSRFERASDELQQATSVASRVLGPRHPTRIAMSEAEAIASYHAGRLERASEVLAEARAQVTAGGEPNPKVVLPLAEWQLYVAVTLRSPDLDPRIAETRALATAAFGEEHPRSAYSRLFPRVYRPERAAEEAADLELLTEVGPEMWGEALSYRVDARILGDAPAAALELLEEARASETWAGLPPATGRVLAGLEAEALLALERYDDAAAALDRVELGEDEQPLPRVELARARLAAHRGDLPAALALLRRLVADYEASFDPEHPELAEVRFALARVLRASGDPGGAQTLANAALTTYRGLGAAFAPEVAAIEAWRAQGS